ncbi:MAG: segregation/condensation protein A [Bryobacteraceae bacterium]
MSSPLNIHLEQYDGPFDLLLDLIRKQQINIHDIPIARITQQYLEYMQKAIEMDIELSSEFVYMAATLIYIKSKTLLPRDPELEKLDPEGDPRKELVDRLLEHERYKAAAEMLHQKRMIEDAVWSNPQMESFLSDEEGPGLAVTLFDLVKTFQEVLDRSKQRPIYEVSGEEVSVPDMIRFLRRTVGNLARGQTLSVRELFEGQKGRRAMICLFLAMLEMVKLQAVGLAQDEAFGEIVLKRSKGFDTAFDFENAATAIEEDYK